LTIGHKKTRLLGRNRVFKYLEFCTIASTYLVNTIQPDSCRIMLNNAIGFHARFMR